MSGLDDVAPLSPQFTTQGKAPVTPEHALRRKAFFERRGVPLPVPRPSWAHAVDRDSFDADWQKDREARRAVFKAQRQSQAVGTPQPAHLRGTFARSIDV